LYRREGDTGWKSLKSGLEEAIFVWDTTSVPNGTYVVKVMASDGASNTPDATLEGELESSAFDIDNGPPAVIVTSARPVKGAPRSSSSARRLVVDLEGGIFARRAALAGDLSARRDLRRPAPSNSS
jgi:hypothetical protein